MSEKGFQRRAAEAQRTNIFRRSLRLCVPALVFVVSLPAATYYVTIAGLGGGPDYEQRFAMWAGEIDKTVKSGGAEAKVETLKGGDYVRVWINKNGNYYLIHLVNG